MSKVQFSKDFKKRGEIFFERLRNEMKDSGIRVNSLNCDHLCFRVGTIDEYRNLKIELDQFAVLLTESPVNGRLISTYRLDEPFETSLGPIDILELPAPKKGQAYTTGFEHAEFVVRESFQTIQRQNPILQFAISGSQFLNPELSLKLASGQIKFHPLALDRIIEIEKAEVSDVIFDFDGTLIESKTQILHINSQVLSEVCQRSVSIEEVREKFSSDLENLFANFGISCAKTREYGVSIWSKLSADFHFPLFEGTRDLLNSLAARKLRLHLWTARDSISATQILEHHNISSFFTTKSFSEKGNLKPNPSSLEFDWNRAPKNSLMVIGDSPSDILGAKNTGALAAAALWDSTADRESLMAAGAELYFYKMSQLDHWLSQDPHSS